MSQSVIYPKEPVVGVDCSGQPNAPPMIAVATRWSRRNKQNKWASKITREQIMRHASKRDWQVKVYAAICFKAIDRVIVAGYDIHLDYDYQDPNTQRKVKGYLHELIGSVHPGDPQMEKPKICFKAKENSKYVREAHKKHGWARDGLMRIDDATGIDYLMKILG